MEEKFSLIVPMINTSKKYENSVPIEFQYDNESGKINCIKSIEGLKLSYIDTFSRIYFIILSRTTSYFFLYIIVLQKYFVSCLNLTISCIGVSINESK